MAIEGQLDYGLNKVIHNSQFSGIMAVLGEDGQNYIKVNHNFQPGGSTSVNLSWIDNHVLYHWTLTQADARTQLGSLGLSGVVAANWFFGAQGGFTAPGLPFIWIPMFVDGDWTSLNPTRNIFLRYKVNGAGSVVFDGYQGGACSQSPKNGAYNHGAIGAWFIGPGETSKPVFGVQLIGSDVYIVMQTGQNFLFSDSIAYHVVKVLTSGNAYDTATGSWDQYITQLPTSGDGYFSDSASLGNSGPAAIMQEPGGAGRLRVFVYLRDAHGQSLGFGGPAMVTVWVHPSTHTTGSWVNCSSTFGIPYSDTLYNFAGVLTTNYRNDYSGPTVIGNDLFMMRPFDDQLHQTRRRQYTIMGADLTDVVTAAAVVGVYTTVNPAGLNGQCEWIRCYRLSGILYTMGRFNQQYVFGDMGAYPFLSPPPAAEYPPLAPPADEDDDLPPAEAVIVTQRWLLRTAHLRQWGEITVDDTRVIIKRGVGDTEAEQFIWLRANRDNRGFGKWVKRSLGKKGDKIMVITFGGFGTARDWQFEMATTDECEIELRKLQILPTRLGH